MYILHGSLKKYIIVINKPFAVVVIIIIDLFWTAPEHLREPEPGYSQKGDIYSFAIVVNEIFTRSAPYEDLDLSAKGALFTQNAILARMT